MRAVYSSLYASYGLGVVPTIDLKSGCAEVDCVTNVFEEHIVGLAIILRRLIYTPMIRNLGSLEMLTDSRSSALLNVRIHAQTCRLAQLRNELTFLSLRYAARINNRTYA